MDVILGVMHGSPKGSGLYVWTTFGVLDVLVCASHKWEEPEGGVYGANAP